MADEELRKLIIRLVAELGDFKQQISDANASTGKKARTQEIEGSFGEGFVDGMKKVNWEITDFKAGMEAASDVVKTLSSSWSAFTSSLTDTTKKGKEKWQEMCKSILTMWLNMINKIIESYLEKGLSSLLNAILPGSAPTVSVGGGGGGEYVAGGEYGWGGMAQAFHAGRGPFEMSPVGRFVPPSVLASAPRFHTGEIPAIIRQDESVLTPGQMKALASMQSQQKVQIELLPHPDFYAKVRPTREEIGVTVAGDIARGGPVRQALENWKR